MLSFGSMIKHYSKKAAIGHGIGLFLILLSGFGMQAKLYSGAFPTWMLVKLIIWFAFGACIVLVKRKVASAPIAWTIIVVLGALAAYLGSMKMIPFTNTYLG